MSKNIDFAVGTIVTDTFLDSLQEILTGTVNNLRLAADPDAPATGIALALVGDTVNDRRGTVNIGGQYAWVDQLKSAETVASVAGDHDIYLSTLGSTAPNFTLSIGAPAVVTGAYLRKIGTLSFNGTQVNNVKLRNGVMADADQYNAFTFRSVINTANETILKLDGQSNQLSATANQTKALVVSSSGTEKLSLDTAGRIILGTDVVIERSAANIAKLASGDKLQQNEAPTVGDDLTNKTYVDTAVGAVSLDDLTDVVITGTPTEGSLLRYDGAPTSQWVNVDTVTIDDDGNLSVGGRLTQGGVVNAPSQFIDTAITYDLVSPDDSILLCKTAAAGGDISIRLTNELSASAIGGNPVADGDIITIKDADGGAATYDLTLIAEGVRKRNVPLLAATSLTGTIADVTTVSTSGGVGVDEVQTFQVTGSGTFEITFDGEETAAVLSEASDAATVEAAINALSPHPNYGYFSVDVAGTDALTGLTVTFDGGALIDGEASYQLGIWESVRVIYKDTAPYGEWFII